MKKQDLKSGAILLLAILLLAAPLLVYQIKFNGAVSSEHKVWAEFGDYISGIYAPILSVLTLIVLFAQVQLQQRFGDTAEVQKYLDTCENDLAFQIEHLKDLFTPRTDEGYKLKNALDIIYSHDPNRLGIEDETGYHLLMMYQVEIVSLWHSVYTTLQAFKNRDHVMYDLAHSRAVLKLQVALTPRTCIALDWFHKSHAIHPIKDGYIYLEMGCRADDSRTS